MMTTDISNISSSDISGPLRTPGAQLRALREALHRSREDIARQLRLSERWVQDLEEDRYENLPSLLFVRGYIRAYSRLVGADPDVMITRFNQMNIKDPEKPLLPGAHISGFMQPIDMDEAGQAVALPRWSGFALLGTAVLISALILGRWFFYGDGQVLLAKNIESVRHMFAQADAAFEGAKESDDMVADTADSPLFQQETLSPEAAHASLAAVLPGGDQTSASSPSSAELAPSSAVSDGAQTREDG